MKKLLEKKCLRIHFFTFSFYIFTAHSLQERIMYIKSEHVFNVVVICDNK